MDMTPKAQKLYYFKSIDPTSTSDSRKRSPCFRPVELGWVSRQAITTLPTQKIADQKNIFLFALALVAQRLFRFKNIY